MAKLPRTTPKSAGGHQKSPLKSERSIRLQLRAVQKGRALLNVYDLAYDQGYGAEEALRWVLGDHPAPVELTKPLGTAREVLGA